MKKLMLPLLLAVSVLPLSAIQARPGADLSFNDNFSFTVSPYTGIMYGFCEELVISDQSGSYPYLSRLFWEINPAVLGGFSFSINQKNLIYLNCSFGTVLNQDTGSMTDYDWIASYSNLVDTEWTHYSRSDIKLTDSLLLDVNIAVRVYRSSRQSVDIMGGFKFFCWDWTDTTLEFDYPSNYSEEDLDKLIGTNGIDYYAEFKIPYIALGYKLNKGRFSGDVILAFSPFVSADAHDSHKNTGAEYYDSFSDGRYLGLSLSAYYDTEKGLAFSVVWDMDYVPEMEGTPYQESGGKRFKASGYTPGIEYLALSLTGALQFYY